MAKPVQPDLSIRWCALALTQVGAAVSIDDLQSFSLSATDL